MNNKLILTFSILGASIIIVLSIWGLVQPGNSVRVSLPEGVESITIDGAERKDGQKFGIKPGTYDYVLTGENIDQSRREVVVERGVKDLVIDYAPYSQSYLDKLLLSEGLGIRSIVNDRYVSKVEDFRLHKIKLIDRGQYAAAIITPTDIDVDNPTNVYRLVLSKSDDSWRVVAGPELLLTTANSEGVDKSILQTVNDLAL